MTELLDSLRLQMLDCELGFRYGTSQARELLRGHYMDGEHRLQARLTMRPVEVRELSHQWLELKTQRSSAIPRATYAKHAFLHPLNVLLLATVLVIGLATVPWLLPFALIGLEVVLLVSASCAPCLRQRLDKELAEAQRRDAEEVRQRLLNRMNDDHRAELEHLELLVDSIRSREGTGDRTSLVLDEHLGLERLTTRYAELAVTYRESRRRLALTDCESIELQLRALDREDGKNTLKMPSRHLALLQEQRRQIARKRRECYEQNLAKLDEIKRELATIAELIRLLHEQTVTANELDEELTCVNNEVDRFMTDLESFRLGLGELSEGLASLDEYGREPGLLHS